jgi:chromosome segregation ATPase
MENCRYRGSEAQARFENRAIAEIESLKQQAADHTADWADAEKRLAAVLREWEDSQASVRILQARLVGAEMAASAGRETSKSATAEIESLKAQIASNQDEYNSEETRYLTKIFELETELDKAEVETGRLSCELHDEKGCRINLQQDLDEANRMLNAVKVFNSRCFSGSSCSYLDIVDAQDAGYIPTAA